MLLGINSTINLPSVADLNTSRCPFAASRFSVNDDDDHVVRCHNVGVRHVRDQVSGRFSVVVPVNLVPVRRVKTEDESGSGFSSPVDSSGVGSVDVDLSFGCLNTCLGAEYSLRNWNIIITLEKRLEGFTERPSCRPGNKHLGMGSHHHQVAILVPDDKLDCFGQLKKIYLVKNGQAFYPGPALPVPSRTDGSSLFSSPPGFIPIFVKLVQSSNLKP